jgi:hypothetical protein
LEHGRGSLPLPGSNFKLLKMIIKKAQFLVTLATSLAKNSDAVIYVAGKITGLPVEEYLAKFKKAQNMLEADGWKVLNPCEFIEPDELWETAMQKAITLLNMSDAVYFLPDWEQSEGAKLEFMLANKFGLSTVFE